VSFSRSRISAEDLLIPRLSISDDHLAEKSKVESATHHESGQAGEDEHEEMSEGQGGSAQNVNQLVRF
jgi:hypothetical protein